MPDDEQLRLDRAYLQVDRVALKALLQREHEAGGVTLMQGTLKSALIATNLFDSNLVHDATGSTLTLSTGEEVRARLIVDATGFESRLVEREGVAASGLWQELGPGYQIAYGMRIEPKDGRIAPYAQEAMTLFDYRTDHLTGSDLLADAEQRPSFVYVMPTEDGVLAVG